MTAGHSIGHDYYVKLWAMIVLAHVTFRHLSYLLSLRPLQQGLRQSLGNPYIRLIVIAAADLISLSVVYGYLTLKYRFASTSQLLDVVRTLVSVQEIFDVIGDKDANIVMVLSKLSELLLFLTILGVLRQIKMFERNDEDYGV